MYIDGGGRKGREIVSYTHVSVSLLAVYLHQFGLLLQLTMTLSLELSLELSMELPLVV